MSAPRIYHTFQDFYPYYLTEHARPLNRMLHFIGTFLVLFLAAIGIVSGKFGLFAWLPVCGYGFAWLGHFVIEKNRPATFKYPLYSLASDFLMFWHILTGQINEKVDEAHRVVGVINKWKNS